MVPPEEVEAFENDELRDDQGEGEEDGGEPEDTIECPICQGTGLVGHFVLEQECGGCSGRGEVSIERSEELETNEWEPIYSTVSELINALDGRDFSDIDLQHYDLSDEDLTGATFGEQYLSGRN